MTYTISTFLFFSLPLVQYKEEIKTSPGYLLLVLTTMEEKEARRPSRIMNWLGSKLKRLFLDNDSTSSNKQDINNDLELLQGLDTILQMFNPRKLDIGIMSVEPELVEETFELSPDFKGNDAVWKLGLNELCEVPDGLGKYYLFETGLYKKEREC